MGNLVHFPESRRANREEVASGADIRHSFRQVLLMLELQTQSAGSADGTVKREAEARLVDLSPRERDVLRGLVAGKINKVIAHDLGISPRTVEVYRANLMAKTNVRSMSELMRIAIAAGL